MAHHLKSQAPQAQIIFSGEFDEFARKKITAFDYLTESEREFNLQSDSDILIVDSYQLDEAHVSQLSTRTKCTVFVDDFGQFPYEKAAVVLNFTANAEKRYSYRAGKSLLGLKFYPVDPATIALREARRTVANLQKILVFFSGKQGSVPTQEHILAEIDRRVSGKTIKLLLPTGLPITMPSSDRNEFIVEPTANSMNEHLAWCDGLISGGGLVKYESAFARVYNGSVATTQGQLQDSKIMHELGLSHYMGFMNDLKTLPLGIDAFFNDEDLRHHQFQCQSNLFDSASGVNLAREILHVR